MQNFCPIAEIFRGTMRDAKSREIISLAREIVSSRFEGSQLTGRKLNASTPTISTPMYTAGDKWTSNQSATGVHVDFRMNG